MTNEPTPRPPADAIAPGAPPPLPPEALAPIPLTPQSPRTAPLPPAKKPATKTPQHHDGFRELIETIVFVVVLVLILKTFLAEAFVIPTGSMATTLLGYHKEIVCEQCGYRFLVNASLEADPGERHPQPVTAAHCDNCQYLNRRVPGAGGGFR
jgi:hypothetical protein